MQQKFENFPAEDHIMDTNSQKLDLDVGEGSNFKCMGRKLAKNGIPGRGGSF